MLPLSCDWPCFSCCNASVDTWSSKAAGRHTAREPSSCFNRQAHQQADKQYADLWHDSLLTALCTTSSPTLFELWTNTHPDAKDARLCGHSPCCMLQHSAITLTTKTVRHVNRYAP